MTDKRIVVVRVRGVVGRNLSIKKTVNLLRLNRTNHCVIIDNRSTYQGMLQKAKDVCTWGELNHDSIRNLLLKRGRLTGNQKITEEYIKENTNYSSIDDFINKFLSFEANLTDIEGLKPVFRLHPPLKGHRRRGVKYPHTQGGALGYRGSEINDLIKQMA